MFMFEFAVLEAMGVCNTQLSIICFVSDQSQRCPVKRTVT